MHWGWRLFCLGIILLTLGHSEAAETRLVLAGGGTRQSNRSAIEAVTKWMAERPGHLLRIRWASQDLPSQVPPSGNSPFPPYLVIKEAPNRFAMEKEREHFVRDLAEASAVHFGGGDQSYIMDTIQKNNLAGVLRAKYRDGTVFSGSSAGTAIMSALMFTGEGRETEIAPGAADLRPGLGLLDSHILVDQHFIAKKRMNRLLSGILEKNITVGLGIDENGAVTIENGRWVTVLKAEKVVAVRKTRTRGRFILDVLEPGQRYDLQSAN